MPTNKDLALVSGALGNSWNVVARILGEICLWPRSLDLIFQSGALRNFERQQNTCQQAPRASTLWPELLLRGSRRVTGEQSFHKCGLKMVKMVTIKNKTYVCEALYNAEVLLCVFKSRRHCTSKKRRVWITEEEHGKKPWECSLMFDFNYFKTHITHILKWTRCIGVRVHEFHLQVTIVLLYVTFYTH